MNYGVKGINILKEREIMKKIGTQKYSVGTL